MQSIIRLAHSGPLSGRFPLPDVLDRLRRMLGGKVTRRPFRPLQDIDGWSDQAEVAYYEDCRLGRCV